MNGARPGTVGRDPGKRLRGEGLNPPDATFGKQDYLLAGPGAPRASADRGACRATSSGGRRNRAEFNGRLRAHPRLAAPVCRQEGQCGQNASERAASCRSVHNHLEVT